VGTIEATGDVGGSTLAYKAPDSETFGTGVEVSDGETAILLDGEDATQGVRVRREDSGFLDYLAGSMGVALSTPIDGFVAGPSLNDPTGSARFSGVFLVAAGPHGVEDLKAWSPPLTAKKQTNGAQLGASGTGAVGSLLVGALDTFNESGFALIRTSGGAIRELVYYTSRTGTVLNVTSAAHRALSGTGPAAGASSDTIEEVSPTLLFDFETPAADGSIQTIASRSGIPAGLSVFEAFSEAEAVALPILGVGEAVGLWVAHLRPSGMTRTASAPARLTLKFTSY
jgi:hypothetical protein